MNIGEKLNKKGYKIYFFYDLGRGPGQRPSTGVFIYATPQNQIQKNYKGNTIVLRKDIQKFGYIIVDVIPPLLEEYNKTKGFRSTSFGTLYKIIPELNQHIEVITFNQLIRAVETRHAPFFDKLFIK